MSDEADRVAHLGDATERLAAEVAGLRGALTKLQSAQRQSVTREEATEAQEQMLRDLITLRKRIRRRGNTMFAVAIVLLLIASGIGAFVLHQQAADRHRACVQRNNGAKAALPFYDREIANLRAHHVDESIVGVMTAARASAQHSIVKC